MTDKSEKSNKLKARLPRGLADRGPAEIAATRDMIEKIRAVYELYGFEPVETPAIEYTDALGKFCPTGPAERACSRSSVTSNGCRCATIDGAAGALREEFRHAAEPYRSYRVGNVFRNEKPGPGRFRQFMQFDADTVGSASPAADAEMCMMAADTMEALGIPRGSYVVKVNNRKVLDGLIAKMGIDPENLTDLGMRLVVLRALDKLDRLGWEGVDQLLGRGRRDESGDFTKGAGLPDDAIYTFRACVEGGLPADVPIKTDPARPMRDMKSNYADTFVDNLYGLSQWFGLIGDTKHGSEGLRELTEIVKICEAAGYGSSRITIDPSVVRGLEYYTGPVFEVELMFSTDSAAGSPRFGSVGGGGRYDGLVSRFRGEPVPATGFSIGVSRLLAALQHLGKVETKAENGPVVVTVFDKDRIADYQQMVASLRNAGIRAELYLGSGKFGPQMKYADKRNYRVVIRVRRRPRAVR